MRYVIGLGTNLGDRKKNISDALCALSLVPKTEVLRCSSVYETEPVGYTEQNSFYNACAEIESALEPGEILGVCLGIEAALGRVREFKNGPRVIDLDVIFARDVKINSKNLTLPHPRFLQRRFVLEPLLELFPSGSAYGVEFESFLKNINGQGVKKIYKL